MVFSKFFDHTILAPTTTPEQLERVCEEAKQNGFCAVAVNTGMVGLCASYLAGSGVKADAAVGFPLGITTLACKLAEAEEAIREGADEVDYVVNIGRVKCGDLAFIEEEMERMTALCRSHGVLCKVIFENCYLTDSEKRALCRIAKRIRPDFIKTSTGFGPGGATVEDVRLMNDEVGKEVKVKAAGGIKDLDTCLAMLGAGAERIGCSSSLAILEAYRKNGGTEI